MATDKAKRLLELPAKAKKNEVARKTEEQINITINQETKDALLNTINNRGTVLEDIAAEEIKKLRCDNFQRNIFLKDLDDNDCEIDLIAEFDFCNFIFDCKFSDFSWLFLANDSSYKDSQIVFIGQPGVFIFNKIVKLDFATFFNTLMPPEAYFSL